MSLCLHRVLDELNSKIQKDHRENSTLPKIAKNTRREKDEENNKNQKEKGKKQSEDLRERATKEKERNEKIPKPKGKQPSKPPRTSWNSSEPLVTTKPWKSSGAKISDNTAKTAATVKTKGKKELKKKAEASRTTESRTEKNLKVPNMVASKPPPGEAASSELKEAPLDMDLKDRGSTGLHSGCSNVTEQSLMGTWRPSEPESTQNIRRSFNTSTTEPRSSKSSRLDFPSETLSPEVSLKSDVTDQTNSTQKLGQTSREPPEEAAASPTLKISSGDDQRADTITAVLKMSAASDQQTNQDSTHTLILNLQEVSSSEAPSNIRVQKVSEATKEPSKPSVGLLTIRDVAELLMVTQQVSCCPSNTDVDEDQTCSTLRPGANQTDTPDASGGRSSEDPGCSELSMSKISTESKTTSITSTATSGPRVLNASDKENREDLALSVKKLLKTSNHSSENRKSWRPPRCRSLTGGVKWKPGSLSLRQAPAALTRCSTETRQRRDDGTNTSTVDPPDSTSADLRASRRSSVFQHQDPEDLKDSLPCSSPPPPPPPPSCTPLLLPPSSTPLIPLVSTIKNHSPPGFPHSLRSELLQKIRQFDGATVFIKLKKQTTK